MKRKTPSLKTCRICRAPISPTNPDFPFCSAACRERDLGNWASEHYRVAAAVSDEEADLPDVRGALRQWEATQQEED